MDIKDLISDSLVMLVAQKAEMAARWVPRLRSAGARDVLLLARSGINHTERHADHVRHRLTRLNEIAMTNCEVAILDGWSSAMLNSKHYFWKTRLRTVLVPITTPTIFYVGGLKYYQRSKRLSIAGETTFETEDGTRRFVVIHIHRDVDVHNRRIFAPHDWTTQQIFEALGGLNYVLLRSIEQIEEGTGFKDIDILVSDDDLPELTQRFRQHIGLFPFEVYAESGVHGHDYQSVPYFFPALARRILTSAENRPSGIRVPSAQYRYLSLAYHLMFHGKSRHLKHDAVLSDETFAKPRHYRALISAARDAGLKPPATLDDIDAHLKAHDAFPSTDILGFYGRRNPFVVKRYLTSDHVKAGLTVFFVRKFDGDVDHAGDVRRAVQTAFQILAEGPVDDTNQTAIQERIRGGNWRDKSEPAGGEPIYWFVCLDPAPAPIGRKLRKKYPHLDNAATVEVKLSLREMAGNKRIVHASDNTAEALEHIAVLGLSEHADLKRAIETLTDSTTSLDVS